MRFEIRPPVRGHPEWPWGRIDRSDPIGFSGGRSRIICRANLVPFAPPRRHLPVWKGLFPKKKRVLCALPQEILLVSDNNVCKRGVRKGLISSGSNGPHPPYAN